MANRRTIGKAGSVAGVNGVSAVDFSRFSLSFNHPVDDDSAYGDSGNGSSHSGSGVVDYNLDASGFAKEGTTGTVSMAMGSGTTYETAGSTTLTLAAGTTLIGAFILSGGRLDHARRAGTVPVSYSGVNDGTIAETIATS